MERERKSQEGLAANPPIFILLYDSDTFPTGPNDSAVDTIIARPNKYIKESFHGRTHNA